MLACIANLPADQQEARYRAMSVQYGVPAFCSGQDLSQAFCYKCQTLGHLTFKCPSRTNRSSQPSLSADPSMAATLPITYSSGPRGISSPVPILCSYHYQSWRTRSLPRLRLQSHSHFSVACPSPSGESLDCASTRRCWRWHGASSGCRLTQGCHLSHHRGS